MNNYAVLQTLAKLSSKKVQEIQPHFSLGTLGLNASFGLSALRSRLEAQGFGKLPPLQLNMSVGDLIQSLTSSKQESTAGAGFVKAVTVDVKVAPNIATYTTPQEFPATAAFPGMNDVGLGMDMQEIGSFKQVSDFRADPFYSAHFTNTEISTAMLKPDPFEHFAGIFCVKEAAKKSHDVLLNLEMRDFLVSHLVTGRPLLNFVGGHPLTGRFRFMVSITHTEHYAAATCLTFGG
jgi:phosphopantetheine--protein transferase-like protein